MKKIILLLFVQTVSVTAGLAQSQPWRGSNEIIPARPDLAITWQETNAFPRQVWLYELLPNRFSPEVISNAMALCNFTDKDKVEDTTNGLVFQNADRTRRLSFVFSSGGIRYAEPKIQYTETNMPVGVPTTNQMPQIAEAILGKLHIGLDNIIGYADAPKIWISVPYGTTYYVNHTNIDIIPCRQFLFRRLVDGLPIEYKFYGGNVGEHGKMISLGIDWPNLKRIKAYPTVSPQEVMDFIRRGTAARGPTRVSDGGIDWPTIKGLEIRIAVPSYVMSQNRLYPSLSLDVTVDTGYSKVGVGMVCPLIDETKL